jgi:hypothetical protein
MPESFFAALATHGPVGAIAAALLWALWQKDKELTLERAARVKQAEAYTTLALDLQGKVITSVQTLSSVFDELRKRGVSP